MEDEEASADHKFMFSSDYVRAFLKNKHIVYIGDSVQRYAYKDMISVLQDDALVNEADLKRRFEAHFANDVLIDRTEIHKGIKCYEFREFQSPDDCHLVQYHFVTRCFNETTENNILSRFAEDDQGPDIVIMNSCLWDVTRYGEPDASLRSYQNKMAQLLERLRHKLHSKAIFIWCTALPIATKILAKGVILDEMPFQAENSTLRIQILEANYNIAQVVQRMGFDVLDLNFYLRPLMEKHRAADGVHWSAVAHRHMTDVILTFLHESWGVPFPQGVIDKLFHYETTAERPHLTSKVVRRNPRFEKLQLRRLEKLANKLTQNSRKENIAESTTQTERNGTDEVGSEYSVLSELSPPPSTRTESREGTQSRCSSGKNSASGWRVVADEESGDEQIVIQSGAEQSRPAQNGV